MKIQASPDLPDSRDFPLYESLKDSGLRTKSFSKMTRVERLTNLNDFKPENIRFGTPKVSNVPGRDITYERIPITIKHDDNFYGSLLIKTEKCFSFGVKENLDKETEELTGWSLPIAMYDREEPTKAQREWVFKFDKIVECCKGFLVEYYEFDETQLDNIANCMWWPKNETTRGPTLYPKIIATTSKRFDTKFRMVKDLENNLDTGVPTTKEELVDNYDVIAVIKIDSIYICGKDAYLQVKVYEALLEEPEELPSLLRPQTTKKHPIILFKD